MSTDIDIQAKRVIDRYARLKNVPVGIVIRNMARDFVRGARMATPEAKIGKSEFYWYRGKDGQKHYLHESIVDKVLEETITATGKKRVKRLKTPLQQKLGRLKKVRIAKGWSKDVWIGAMRALGMESPTPRKNLPAAVVEFAQAIQQGLESPTPEIDLTARIRFDAIPGASGEIIAAGWARARMFFLRNYKKTLREAGAL